MPIQSLKKNGETYYLYSTTDGIKLASGDLQVLVSKDFVNCYNTEIDIELVKSSKIKGENIYSNLSAFREWSE
ncbi:hypothetical protein GQR60_05775 [Labilibaculum sp. A4]|uniref:hypothetical protein n=1 Tax=Labilibaculum euxinus TaxID=2686357 RepID=UPI000F6170FF|nr:hypothetical protein [Labilibaculum euxinus]MDQ1770666.1 hypothetical protein [Labilibaculum euxinus]MWN75837.1 hypothetical protein [Labilibaculum euxinus]